VSCRRSFIPNQTFTQRWSQSKGRGGQDRLRSCRVASGRPDVSLLRGFRIAPDHHLRPGRIASGGCGRPLRRRHNVHVELAEPRVRYRETIKARRIQRIPSQKANRRRGPIRRSSGCASNPNRATQAWIHQFAGRPECGSRVRAVRREGRETSLHRGILAGYAWWTCW